MGKQILFMLVVLLVSGWAYGSPKETLSATELRTEINAKLSVWENTVQELVKELSAVSDRESANAAAADVGKLGAEIFQPIVKIFGDLSDEPSFWKMMEESNDRRLKQLIELDQAFDRLHNRAFYGSAALYKAAEPYLEEARSVALQPGAEEKGWGSKLSDAMASLRGLSSEDAMGIVRDMLSMMDELSALLDGITDSESAYEAAGKIGQWMERVEAMKAYANAYSDSLPKLTDEIKEQVDAKSSRILQQLHILLEKNCYESEDLKKALAPLMGSL